MTGVQTCALPILKDEAQDAKAVTRDYTIKLSQKDHAPLVNIYGGKITTYRTLAEAAVDKLKKMFPKMKPAWTKKAALPGGDFANRQALYNQLLCHYPWLPRDILSRYVRQYGTLSYQILENCHTLEDLGQDFGQGLYQKEVCYLSQHEWAKSADDVLWRRTKLGLKLTAEQKEQLNRYFTSKNHYHDTERCCA